MTMCRRFPCSFGLILMFSLACERNTWAASDDSQNLAQWRNEFESLPPTDPRRQQILHDAHDLATRNASQNAATLVWIGQQWSSGGNPHRATSILQQAIASGGLAPPSLNIARFELGLACQRAGDNRESAVLWDAIARDDSAERPVRELAAEQLRAQYVANEKWADAAAIARLEWDLGIGSQPVLLETLARSSRRLGAYEDAAAHYRRLLDDFPSFRPQNRMVYIEKAFLTCKYSNQRERLEYVREMRDILEVYGAQALARSMVYAEILQERYELGRLYESMVFAYAKWTEPSPISDATAKSLAVEQYLIAIQGLKDLPPKLRKNIEFDTVLRNSYLRAIEVLVDLGRSAEADALRADMTVTFALEDRDRLPEMLTRSLHRSSQLVRTNAPNALPSPLPNGAIVDVRPVATTPSLPPQRTSTITPSKESPASWQIPAAILTSALLAVVAIVARRK